MAAVTIGQVIDSYRIARQIGEGGMGAVYEAVHVVLGQRAAIKVLTSDFRAQPAILQRFVNEARAASQINHPGIVKVFDMGHLADGLPWLSMEYLEGQSLAGRIQRAARRPSRCLGMDDFWIIGDLASALGAAHAKGIIHRDLKPANIMIVPDPTTMTGERAKVLDFGVAKLHSDQLTKSGAILGTPLYMALEQFKDSAEVDGRADVFSLGVIGYELLAGRRPHGGQTHFEVMGARMMEPILPLQQLVPSLPKEVAALVMRMLEREAVNRPTMAEVEVAVRRALGLPQPRQSGWHNALPTPAQADARGELPGRPDNPLPLPLPLPMFDSSGDTPDATASAAAGLGRQLSTPSSEKALGELSPPSAVAIPNSLSSMPSVPVAIPALRASPEARTAQPAPTPFIPRAVASPSMPTVPESQGAGRRVGIFWGAALAVLLMGSVGATIALWPQQQPRLPGPGGVGAGVHSGRPATPAPPTLLGSGAGPGPVSPPGPAPPPPSADPDAEGTAEPAPAAGKKSGAASRGSSRGCEPQQPTLEACTLSPPLPSDLGKRLMSALRESGAMWCFGEALVLSGLPSSPAIHTAPASLHADLKQPLLFTLRGILRGQTFPTKVKVQCRSR